MATVFFYPHIFTGSVGRRILIVVPVDTLYRTSIISSLTVLPLNVFVILSLDPLSLFSIYGPDLGVWPDCWVSAEFLCAPIPRKGSGSTTTIFKWLVVDSGMVLDMHIAGVVVTCYCFWVTIIIFKSKCFC